MKPKKTLGKTAPVEKASAKNDKPKVFGEIKFEYFGYDLAKIRRHWKKITTSQEAQAYLHMCQTNIEHMDRNDLPPIMGRNSDSFKQHCQDKAEEGFHPERMVIKGPLPIYPEHVRECLLIEITGQLKELDADTQAGKKELNAFRKLNWLGEMEELKAVFKYLRDHGLIEVKRDFNVMICELCLYRGQEISIKSLGSAVKDTDEGTTFARRQQELDMQLEVKKDMLSD